jgi:hypothetical protein
MRGDRPKARLRFNLIPREESQMKRIVTAIALIALFVAAAPASAAPKTLYYEGETVDGNSLSFSLKGKQVSDIEGYVTTTCVSTHGTPVLASGEFSPPGSFALGRTRKASETEYISYKGDVTKNYAIGIKKGKGRVWIADLHVNYSYEEISIVGPGSLERNLYVCQGDDSFKFIV